MGRPRRVAAGGYAYHVLNRANAQRTIFEDEGDFAAFESVLLQAVERTETRLLAFCLMPNHWHLVVWPRREGELSQFVGWLTLTHTQALARPPEFAGHGARLSRTVQVVSDSGRRASLHRCSVCGAQRPASQARPSSGAVAVGQPLSLVARQSRGPAVAECLASRTTP